MKDPITLWNHFAYRHRAWAYFLLLATTALLVAGHLVTMLETLQWNTHILSWDNLFHFLMMLGISISGALLMIFAVPARSPWD